MATHSSVLAWRIPQIEEPDGLQSKGSQESDTTKRPNHHHRLLTKSSHEGGKSVLLSPLVLSLSVCLSIFHVFL